jgi:hypothetical protein
MRHFSVFVILFVSIIGFAQNKTLQGRVVEESTKKPVPFANVLLSDNYGVITNNEGYFVLQTKDFSLDTPITFSSMGFAEKKMIIRDFENGQEVVLAPANNVLEEVIITNANLTVPEILQKLKENLQKNHALENIQLQVFMRTKTTSEVINADFSLKDAANLSNKEIKELNQGIKTNQLVKVEPYTSFEERLLDIYKGKDSTKISHQKILRLGNPEKENNNDAAQSKLMQKVFSNLESEHTFNIKSGIIPIKKNANIKDFVSLRKRDSIPNKLGEEYQSLFSKNRLSQKDFIENMKDYNFTKLDLALINGQVCYHLQFEPKRSKTIFKGNLYVQTSDFAIIKYDYQMVDGEKMNSVNLKFLLGIKFNTFARKEMALFQKSSTGTYVPKYIQTSVSNYIYFDRSLSFTENNPDKKARKELKFAILQESKQHANNELLVIESITMQDADLQQLQLPKYIFPDELTKYDASYWKNYNILEATNEIKKYE